MEIIDIKMFLAEQSGQAECYCYPNPGNAGDTLIAAATYQLFDTLGIQYNIIDVNKEFDSRDKIVFYSGGGNLVRRGQCARDFIARHHKKARKLILLPHTVDSHEDLLQQLGDNVLIVAREKRTYDFLEKNTSGAQLFLAHDMALSLDVVQLMGYQPPGAIKSIVRAFMAYVRGAGASTKPARPLKQVVSKLFQAIAVLRAKDKRILNAFRQDVEGRRFIKPADNIDVSVVFAFGTHSKEAVFTASHELMNFLNRYDVVNTDRLHACIGAALLGKEVYFYANDYFKCEEVYKISLSEFDNVHWKGNEMPG